MASSGDRLHGSCLWAARHSMDDSGGTAINFAAFLWKPAASSGSSLSMESQDLVFTRMTSISMSHASSTLW